MAGQEKIVKDNHADHAIPITFHNSSPILLPVLINSLESFACLLILRNEDSVYQRNSYSRDQVPISQEERYFSCSGVRISISTPMDFNFSLAISLSIWAGTG